MLVREGIFCVAVLACCQLALAQTGMRSTRPQFPTGRTRIASAPAYTQPAYAAPATVQPQAMPAYTPSAPAYSAPGYGQAMPPIVTPAPAINYGMGPGYGDFMAGDGACYDGSCGPCGTFVPPWWHRAFVWSYWKCKGLPSPWHSPTDMTLHVPYCSDPNVYYYFRPYNWFHIPEQQQEANRYGTDPRNPYDNRVVFDGLYQGLE